MVNGKGRETWGKAGRDSGEFVERDFAGGVTVRLEQGFNSADGFGRELDVAAHITNFSRHVVDDDDLAARLHGVNDRARFLFARTPLNRALHGLLLLSRGVTHLGGFGS